MKPNNVHEQSAQWTPQELGKLGESIAKIHLEKLGYTVITQNWRPTNSQVRGELDIIAVCDETLVVCEVKARRSHRQGTPAEAVTPQKLLNLKKLAAEFLKTRNEHFTAIRIEVIGITLAVLPSQHVQVKELEHLTEVF